MCYCSLHYMELSCTHRNCSVKQRVRGEEEEEGEGRRPTNAERAEDCLLPSWSPLPQCKAVPHEPLYVPHLFLFMEQTYFAT